MKLTVAALCDRATVREGLLHILGAGVSQVAMPFLPAPPDVDLALLLTAQDYRELAGAHKVSVRVLRDEDGQQVASAEFRWEGPDLHLTEDAPSPSLPLSVPIRGMPVPTYGMYKIVVDVDDEELTALPLLIKAADETFGGVTPQS